MIKLKNVSKIFNSGGSEVRAVDGVSMEVADGIFCAVLGKSGSGKSTLLGIMGALDRPSSGSVTVGDREITKMSDRNLIKYRRDEVGFVFQNYGLVPNLTALENVMLPMEFAGVKSNERRQRAHELLNQVGLDEGKQKRTPLHLSGGEQQRVSIARALANKPRLILADEPTGNLDSNTGKMIEKLLKDLAKSKNTTVIAVTHDETIAKEAELVFKLKDGKLI